MNPHELIVWWLLILSPYENIGPVPFGTRQECVKAATNFTIKNVGYSAICYVSKEMKEA